MSKKKTIEQLLADMLNAADVSERAYNTFLERNKKYNRIVDSIPEGDYVFKYKSKTYSIKRYDGFKKIVWVEVDNILEA